MTAERNMVQRIRATYRVSAPAAQAAALGERIAYEQTVELPAAIVTDPHVLDAVVGRVEALHEVDEGLTDIVISYSAELGNLHLSQFFNLVFGNVSIYPGVRLADLRLPDSFLVAFKGPNHGVQGLRRRLGVYGRPLLATAVKPNGLPLGELAGIARAFAAGGGDIVKDDQNLIDDFASFKRRTLACRDAVREGCDLSGRPCLYFPHVSAPGPALRQFFEYVASIGLEGVLVCPQIAGFDSVRLLAEETGLVIMAHPSMLGTFAIAENAGVEHGLLFGTWMRLAGADIAIFPSVGGRFSLTGAQCDSITARLREPLGEIAPAWPSPAGGLSYDNLPQQVARYGDDSVILIGGALFGHSPELTTSTEAFVRRLQRCGSACRYHSPVAPAPAPPLAERYFAFDDYQWQGRPGSPYKDAADDSFKGVRRVELIGKYGEPTNADLRYFEVEPGGYSCRESHLHTHIVIGARGEGVLVLGDEKVPLKVNDVAYVEPLQAHQLRNETDEPFGFFCIVDHERDRPVRLPLGQTRPYSKLSHTLGPAVDRGSDADERTGFFKRH